MADTKSKTVNIGSASKTLAQLLSEAVPDGVIAVTLITPEGSIHYNPRGTASQGNSILPPVYTVYERKESMDQIQLYAPEDTQVGIIVHED